MTPKEQLLIESKSQIILYMGSEPCEIIIQWRWGDKRVTTPPQLASCWEENIMPSGQMMQHVEESMKLEILSSCI